MGNEPNEAPRGRGPDAEGVSDPSLQGRISSETYEEWSADREFRRNIREGRPWMNTPPPSKPPERHSPSQLHQCHRKIYYRQLNAPEESEDPSGIFWSGTKFEEEVMMPYLESIFDGNAYVRNSMWVDYEIETENGSLRIKGETDPVIVDAESRPLLITEIKTKRTVDNVTEPNEHHLAQTYAYMEGLSQEWEIEARDAVIIYGSRTTLDIQVFHVQFDQDRWKELVVDWAETHTEYRLDEELPPAEPEFGWECQFCSYKHRCGQGDSRFEDVDADGFLTLFADYPEEKVVEYLDGREGAKLTPTLAKKYSSLVESHEVHRWRCPRCSSAFDHCDVGWDGSTDNPPLCPSCVSEDIPVSLVEPSPEEQRVKED